jgi:hypothetical protein
MPIPDPGSDTSEARLVSMSSAWISVSITARSGASSATNCRRRSVTALTRQDATPPGVVTPRPSARLSAVRLSVGRPSVDRLAVGRLAVVQLAVVRLAARPTIGPALRIGQLVRRGQHQPQLRHATQRRRAWPQDRSLGRSTDAGPRQTDLGWDPPNRHGLPWRGGFAPGRRGGWWRWSGDTLPRSSRRPRDRTTRHPSSAANLARSAPPWICIWQFM